MPKEARGNRQGSSSPLTAAVLCAAAGFPGGNTRSPRFVTSLNRPESLDESVKDPYPVALNGEEGLLWTPRLDA
jgi:hypothetical protein